MFTGLIEETGTIKSIKPIGAGLRITVTANKVFDDLKIDDSIALNGVCQTVVSLTSNTFDVEAVEETLKKSTLSKIVSGKQINLERAMRLGDRFGGHIVQGHVDCRGTIINIQKQSAGILVRVSFPKTFRKYIVPVGSICIDGVSLTVASVESDNFMVSIIPHTWNVTTLSLLKSGSEVNLEFDIIGKYIENLVNNNEANPQVESPKSILEQFIDQPY
jgi:riboflavin synthase